MRVSTDIYHYAKPFPYMYPQIKKPYNLLAYKALILLK